MAGSPVAEEPPHTVEEVLASILASVRPLAPAEVPLDGAAGLVLAEDLLAPWPLPPFDNAAMDGFAVRAADLEGARPGRPVRLRVAGSSFAGASLGAGSPSMEPGTAAIIATGALVPAGADAVVRLEDTCREDEHVLVLVAPVAGDHIRLRGEDVAEGAVLAPAGTALGAGQVAAAAAVGRTALTVHPRPRVAVLPTGDEVAPPGATLEPGQIHDASGPALVAILRDLGCRPVLLPAAPDLPDRLRDALRAAASAADAVVTVGGASMGERDFLRRALSSLGELRAWRVALRPAKPFAFGLIGGVPVFGLPGNVASSLVAFEVFVRPALSSMLGRAPGARPSFRAELEVEFAQQPGRLHLIRARCRRRGDRLMVRPAGPQGAAMIGSLAAANAWLVVPPDVERLPAGTRVEVWPMLPGPAAGWPAVEGDP